jgi:hypothetical protein
MNENHFLKLLPFLFILSIGVSVLANVRRNAHDCAKTGQCAGKPGWAAAAKLVVIFGVLGTFGHFADMRAALWKQALVATGAAPSQPATLEMRADGHSILLAGGINDGSAEQLDAALQKAPAVTTLVLSSGGGWVGEAELLANLIRKRGLNTYVEAHCASACTIVFLAGTERTAAPSAKIGFHAARAVGSMGIFYDEKNDRLRALYQNAGLPEAFVRQAINTPSEKMWYPTHEDLRSAGVLTRASMGGQTAALSTAVRSNAGLIAGLKKID